MILNMIMLKNNVKSTQCLNMYLIDIHIKYTLFKWRNQEHLNLYNIYNQILFIIVLTKQIKYNLFLIVNYTLKQIFCGLNFVYKRVNFGFGRLL